MERIPPPAPLRACATLSDCWAAVVVGAIVFKSVDIGVVEFG